MRDEVFAEVTYHAAYEPQRAVRTVRWTYIRRFGQSTTLVLPNCDDSPSKDVWLRAGWRDQPVAAEQLYDDIFDPAAARNVALDPAYGAVLADMRLRLQRWMEATNDPLLPARCRRRPGRGSMMPTACRHQKRRLSSAKGT